VIFIHRYVENPTGDAKRTLSIFEFSVPPFPEEQQETSEPQGDALSSRERFLGSIPASSDIRLTAFCGYGEDEHLQLHILPNIGGEHARRRTVRSIKYTTFRGISAPIDKHPIISKTQYLRCQMTVMQKKLAYGNTTLCPWYDRFPDFLEAISILRIPDDGYSHDEARWCKLEFPPETRRGGAIVCALSVNYGKLLLYREEAFYVVQY